MTKHGSASPRKQASRTLDANLKRRARKLATDSVIAAARMRSRISDERAILVEGTRNVEVEVI